MMKSKFEHLVSKHALTLKPQALQFTKDNEDADDLIQDTVLKAIVSHKHYKDGTNLKGWLYTIMRNTFINNYRKLIRVNKVLTTSDEVTSKNLLFSSIENKGENRFVMEDIQEALANLQEEYYVPFTMYFEGYKYHEIADYLQMPIGTVKTRIHEARKILKNRLRPYTLKDHPINFADVDFS